MTDYCYICHQYACKCAADIADVDAWCDAALGDPGLYAEYERRVEERREQLAKYECGREGE